MLWRKIKKKYLSAILFKMRKDRRRIQTASPKSVNGVETADSLDIQDVGDSQLSEEAHSIISFFQDDHPSIIFESPSQLNGAELERQVITVTDRKLDLIFEKEPLYAITYGGIETVALILHPKMRVYEDIKLQDVELEVEKSFALLRYEDMKQNKVNVNLSQGNTDSNLPHICSTSG